MICVLDYQTVIIRLYYWQVVITMIQLLLVGGLEHSDHFSIYVLGMSSSQLTKSYFSEGQINQQPDYYHPQLRMKYLEFSMYLHKKICQSGETTRQKLSTLLRILVTSNDDIHDYKHVTRVLTCSNDRKKILGGLTGWCPPVISWFINPINYSYICHKPQLLEL